MSAPRNSSAIRPTTYTGAHRPTIATACSPRDSSPRGWRAHTSAPPAPSARPTTRPPASRLTSAGRPSRISVATGRREPVVEKPKSKCRNARSRKCHSRTGSAPSSAANRFGRSRWTSSQALAVARRRPTRSRPAAARPASRRARLHGLGRELGDDLRERPPCQAIGLSPSLLDDQPGAGDQRGVQLADRERMARVGLVAVGDDDGRGADRGELVARRRTAASAARRAARRPPRRGARGRPGAGAAPLQACAACRRDSP